MFCDLVMVSKSRGFVIEQLRLCDRTRHAYEVKNNPNTHLRGRPKKVIQKRVK